MSSEATSAGAAPQVVIELALARRPTLGTGRLVCVEGPAGSGKTTLATAIAAGAPADLGLVPVVHMDDLYEGWSGLGAVERQVATLLRPLAAGRPGRYRRYDWIEDRWAETVEVLPAPLLVLEGVGAGARAHMDLCTVLVHVTAPDPLRLRRGLVRDGAAAREHWLRWMIEEQEMFAQEGPAGRADVTVETG